MKVVNLKSIVSTFLLVVFIYSTNAQSKKGWEIFRINCQSNSDCLKSLGKDTYFWSADSGVTISEFKLFRTYNGGKDWAMLKDFSNYFSAKTWPGIGYSNLCNFIDKNTFYVSAVCKTNSQNKELNGYWYCRTYDGGITWTETLSDTTYNFNFISKMEFADKNKGIIGKFDIGNGIYTGTNFYYTEDAGQTLIPLIGGNSHDSYGSVFYTNDGKIFLSSSSRTLGVTSYEVKEFKNWDSLKSGIYSSLSRAGLLKRIKEHQYCDGSSISYDDCKTWKYLQFGQSYEYQYMMQSREKKLLNNCFVYVEPSPSGTKYIKYFAPSIEKIIIDSSEFPYGNLEFFPVTESVGFINTDSPFVLLKTFNKGNLDELIQKVSQGIMKNEEVKKGLKIYPNPTSQSANIELTEKSNFDYIVVNTLGQTVLNGNSFSEKLTLDLSRFEPGVYFITISIANPYQSQTQKMILK
ncbi:MAG: T9SS type A sorting domain-containing protein [Bacteroidetes bacterium]|nr:T9SS type A sorting domain-containing protein [Bacteroidota bacterium]